MPRKRSKYHQKVRIPIKIKESHLKQRFKTFVCLTLGLLLILSQTQLLGAYEAHIINVTAHICIPLETGTIGFWRNHSEIYEHYLPQYLGTEPVNTIEDADEIFNDANAKNMRNMLKGQLLATKFNIAHFEVGSFPIEGHGTVADLAAEADELLEDPEATREEMEIIKNLLLGINEAENSRYCRPNNPHNNVTVLVPNGGESWWVGRIYDIEWETQNLNCSGDSVVDIWYSGDSGKTFGNIVKSTENDGVFEWDIRLYLNFKYFIPSDQARIKVIARCADDLSVAGWDMSDEDFCPPIDYDLLRPEEIQVLVDLGYIEDPNAGIYPLVGGSLEQPEEPVDATSSEEIPEETSTSTETEVIPEETSTSTENLTQEELVIEEPIEESTSTEEETLPEEEIPSTEEVSTSTEEIIEEATSTEEMPEEPAEEATSTEEVPENLIEEDLPLENETTTSEVASEEPVEPEIPPEEPEKPEKPIEPEEPVISEEPVEPKEPTEPEILEEPIDPVENDPIPET